MGINKLVFAALTVGCLAAAGLGGFLAVRYGQPAVAADTPSAAPVAAPAPGAPAAVTESEGVITPAPAESPVPRATPPVAEAAPVPRKAAPAPSTRQPAPSRPAPRLETRRAEAAPARTPPPAAEPAPAPLPENTGSMWETRAPVEPEAPPVVVAEVAEPPAAPPAPEYIDLQVPADSVLGIQVERTVTSDTARVEDKVTARVTRDVRVGARTAIPAGAIVTGSVTEVERGGKMKGKARLAVRFHTVTLTDGTQLAIRTDAVVREGESPSRETAAKVGGAAIGGAILGAILGGGRGAAIGAGVGAAGGTAAAMTNDPNPATLPGGTSVTVRVQQPLTVTVPRE
ncbi:MAG: hypothetical protein IT179_11870 [Acidobacteria bacterium]|nr:hypothetical protein [Acidobacteriota bacterium]